MEYLKYLAGDKPIVRRNTQLPEKPATEIVEAFANTRNNRNFINSVYSIIIFDNHPTMHCPWYLPIKDITIYTPPAMPLYSCFGNSFTSYHISNERTVEFSPGSLDNKENFEIAKLVNDWISIPINHKSFNYLENLPRAWFVLWHPFDGPVLEIELNKLIPTQVDHQMSQYSGQDLQIDTKVKAVFLLGDAYEPVAPQYKKLLDPPTIEGIS